MQDFEKLGAFYLGCEFDADSGKRTDNLILYDSKDLVTHAVCVGMTGSGKTGLCIGLLEEAAIDGIPSLIIDPKGDLANILLTFPDLRGEDFLPWISEDEARNKGLSPQDFAAQQADKWKQGLADWGQDAARIRRLREAAEFAVYTPGSTAGIPVSILKSFAAPDRSVLGDPDLLREKIGATVTGLLGLLGIEGNPIQSREHILLSTLFDSAWKQGVDLDLASLIQQVQNPPVNRIGVFDLESFYPSKDRFQLAMMMNNLLAAPGFDVWMQGAALDPGSLLYTAGGKPRVCVISIAHLGDAERMFFVTLLLTQVLGWMRAQPGTGSLRAILYMDEIFGFFPPVANPPAKAPLLTLLKQARAFGLGVVLATQNPVDLDYKGLANTGTWFIGRLQTEQDKARLLDGLEGAAGARFERSRMEALLSGLQSRVFLMNNVHEDQPVLFQTRWTLSYLRGPLTRTQIQALKGSDAPSASPASAPVPEPKSIPPGLQRPVLPPGIPESFIPPQGYAPDQSFVYKPGLLGVGKIYYADAKAGVASEQEVARLLDLREDTVSVEWQESSAVEFREADLDRFPAEDATYEPLPGVASQPKSYATWARSFSDWMVRTQSLSLLRSPSLGRLSNPGEAERDFRIRLQQAAREERDRAVEQLRRKYAPKLAALQERIRKAEQAVAREADQAKQAKMQTAISFGTTVFGALFGRKKLSVSSLGRATTAARGVGRSMKEAEDIGRAQETVAVLKQQYADMETGMAAETESIVARIDPQTETLESVELKPKKSNVTVKLVTLVWTPRNQDS